MKTCSSLVKMISDGGNNCMQNKCNKRMKYNNVLPNHKNANMGPYANNLHSACVLDKYANSKLIIKTYFYTSNA